LNFEGQAAGQGRQLWKNKKREAKIQPDLQLSPRCFAESQKVKGKDK
jgi:hypothetical protein